MEAAKRGHDAHQRSLSPSYLGSNTEKEMSKIRALQQVISFVLGNPSACLLYLHININFGKKTLEARPHQFPLA